MAKNMLRSLICFVLIILSACTLKTNVPGTAPMSLASTAEELTRVLDTPSTPHTVTPTSSQTPFQRLTDTPLPTATLDLIATSVQDTVSVAATQAYDGLRRIYLNDKSWANFGDLGVSSIAIVSEDDVWFLSDHLLHFDGSRVISYTLPISSTVDSSDLIIDPAGNVWMPAGRAGILRFDGQHWHRYTTQQGLPIEVDRLLIGPDKTLWAVMQESGSIYRYNGSTWEFYWSLEIEEKGLSRIDDVSIDRDGVFWMANGALATLNGLKFQYYSDAVITGFVSECGIRLVKTAPDGSVWLKSCGGFLIHYHPSKFRFGYRIPEMRGDEGADLYVAPDGDIWVRPEWVTRTEKLRAYQWDGKRWTVYEGFPVDKLSATASVWTLAVSGNGTVWISTTAGLYRYKP